MMTKLLQYTLVVLSFGCSLALAESSKFPAAGHESIEWCDIWIPHANETNLPRVLLIGDSIARNYYPEVERQLAGKAYVARLTTSRFIGDPVLLQEIALVLDNTKFQVIHFNNGIHGQQHSEEEYQRAFPKFLAAIRQRAPEAKLIWASTTPMKNAGSATDSSNRRIAARNAIAKAYVTKQGIEVDDLNALMHEHPGHYRDNVHFDNQAIQWQANQVAEAIRRSLPK